VHEFDPEFGGISDKMGFTVTVQNLGNETVEIRFPHRTPVEEVMLEAIVYNPLEETIYGGGGLGGGISSGIQLIPNTQYSYKCIDRVIYLGYTYKPGIYMMEVSFSNISGLPVEPSLTSNTICFAILPKD
jgi:hypothetical protein